LFCNQSLHLSTIQDMMAYITSTRITFQSILFKKEQLHCVNNKSIMSQLYKHQGPVVISGNHNSVTGKAPLSNTKNWTLLRSQ